MGVLDAPSLRQIFCNKMKRSPLSRGALLAAGLLFLTETAAWAIHPNNPGPLNFDLKFKLPAPAPLSPAEALKTFKLPPGFKIEIVAAEPLVEAPVAMSFDDQARLFVVEMRGYMHDIEGKGEDEPLGRIRLLEDSDGDGIMDKATIFVDKLFMPRGVMAVAGGALVAEPPNLIFFRDTNGDGVADERKIVATDFAVKGGQPETMANGPIWTLDNWIYSSNYRTRFRYEQGKWIADRTSGRGQWGLTQDDYGRLYHNSNTEFLRGDMVPAHYYSRNPNYTGSAGLAIEVMRDQTVWPSHPTPGVNRGYEGSLRDDGTLRACTAACGPGIYRGDLFPKEFHGNAFIPEPSANLVKRAILAETNGIVSARNADEGTEFLTSTDERFRPVNAYTGPDGALYLVDLYRGVLQHKSYLTHYLIANIKQRQLEQPLEQGRIYRIVPDGAAPKPVKLPKRSAELLAFLAHPNGWVRDTAQRLLVERREESVTDALNKMAVSHPNALGRRHALWTLEGIGGLEPSTVVACFKDADAKVRATAIRLSESFLVPTLRAAVLPDLLKLIDVKSADVQIQLAFSLSGVAAPETEEAVAIILRNNAGNTVIRDAAVSGLRGRELELLEKMAQDSWSASTSLDSVLSVLAQCVMKEGRAARIQRLLQFVSTQVSAPARQLAVLGGMAGFSGIAKKAPSPRLKMIYLEAQPEALKQLQAKATDKTKPLLASIDGRLAWPGKPGVPPPPIVVPLNPAQQSLFDKGREWYGKLCINCHQPNGVGQEGLAPPLLDSEWVLGSPDRLARILMHGLSGPITVNDVQYRLEMPGLPDFKDEDIAAVLTYIRREWEHNASPVSVESVTKAREVTKDRVTPWTAAELLKVR
jgi:mono/diheme cytochrome c family protein/glucose/arabinose dehydrogenase